MNNLVWEQLDNNLQVEWALKMEATNSTITKTHNYLCNVRFMFDDINIYLQVQVMPNAPYDILLGPILCPYRMCHQGSGYQHLIIIDPNTCQCVTILTREQKRQHHLDLDF
jgi:hypothetical protein